MKVERRCIHESVDGHRDAADVAAGLAVRWRLQVALSSLKKGDRAHVSFYSHTFSAIHIYTQQQHPAAMQAGKPARPFSVSLDAAAIRTKWYGGKGRSSWVLC